MCNSVKNITALAGGIGLRNILFRYKPSILNVVYVFLLLSMYSYCSSMYSYCCLCILIVVYVFLRRGYPD